MSEGLLMKCGEVKRLLNVSRKTVYAMVERGEIRAVKVGGQRMYETRSVEEWARRNGVRV